MNFILSKEEFEKEKDIIKRKIAEEDAVFIYPTDTIYGIGCNALSSTAVQKIRDIKHRSKNPFSIIAPSKEWIGENCIVNNNAQEWIKRLPGPYTLILKKKNECVSNEVAPDKDSLGVRIPDHWFFQFVNEIGIPIVSTSVNITRKDFMTSLEDLDPEVKSKVDFIIYDGPKEGRPSKIIDLTDEVKVTER
tara:strand:- start:451 stop:1023 length:573 start_codon:yes stop_codon:yes gene_type:complete